MHKKTKAIPVNTMAGKGIAIERTLFTNSQLLSEGERSHRHDSHSFFLLQSGSITVEIDFHKHILTAPAFIYLHPDQVHRTLAADNITVCSWAITNENLNPDYVSILEDITPAKPLALNKETFSIILEAVLLCLKFAERKNDKLYHYLLKDSCNALVALVISQYLEGAKSKDNFSRFEFVTKEFRDLLKRNYTRLKRPMDYAEKLNISAPYLNECVKNTTGYSVSYHIQQRIILEAKRLLYHSGKSVKEIAADLGYYDYPYFSRLFVKVTGMTALTFRNKNHD